MITMPVYYPNYINQNLNTNCCCPNRQVTTTQPAVQQPAQQPLPQPVAPQPMSIPYYQPFYTYPQANNPTYFPPQNYTNGSILNNPYAISQKPFIFKNEERQYLKDNPKKDITDFLIKTKNYKRAVEYVDSNGEPKNLPILQKYFNNPSFDSLANSKFTEGESGFVKLVNTIYNLDKSHSDAYNKVHSPNYRSITIPDMTANYAAIDVNNCIKNIDNFFKSEKISDDLKKYIFNKTDVLSDLWITGTTLGKKDITVDDLIYPRMAM